MASSFLTRYTGLKNAVAMATRSNEHATIATPKRVCAVKVLYLSRGRVIGVINHLSIYPVVVEGGKESVYVVTYDYNLRSLARAGRIVCTSTGKD
jgi:hypothetical protein